MAIPVAGYLNWEFVSPGIDNPFKYLLFIQHHVGVSETGEELYRKGWGVSSPATF